MTTPKVDLRTIATPIDECTSLRVGPVFADVVSALEQHHFDQAPVIDAEGLAIGVIDTKVARQLLDEGEHIDGADQQLERRRLPLISSATDILTLLSDSTGVLVEDERGRVFGLLTMSDLNRFHFRSLLYSSLAELEALLARLVEMTFQDQWLWIDRLNVEAQARIVGYWQLAIRKDVDIGPVAACTLTELLRIIVESPDLTRGMGWSTRKEAGEATGSLPELRNTVMHPVRPLVLNKADVATVARREQRVIELISRARALLGDRE